MNNTRRKQIRAIAARLESVQSDLREIWLGELESARQGEEAAEQLDSAVDVLSDVISNLKEI